MPPGICQHGMPVRDTDNLCEQDPAGGAHREYVA